MNKIFKLCQIRYNTQSNGSDLCWRLVLDGDEYLVNDIEVYVPCFTTKDWLEDLQAYKHHITIKESRVVIDDNKIAKVLPTA